MLVALTIGGLVVSSIFQLISGQGRFVELQSAREEVQQNTRASLELISSELRTMPAGASLVMASSDSLTIRAARIWGVVCEVVSATSLDIAVPILDGASYATNLGTGAVVNLGTSMAPLWSSAVAVTAIADGVSNCSGAALPAGAQARRLTLSATPSNGSETPALGDGLYIYDQVTYRTGTSTGVPGLWIQRRVGEGVGATNQPMAGPIDDETGGLRFSYFAGSSSTPLTLPITDATIRSTVNRIVVVVESVSRNSFGDDRESKTDTVIVPLRNRI